MNVSEILVRSSEKWPEKAAVIDRHGAMDYRTLFNETADLSRTLLESGIGPGHGVGIMSRSGREFIVAAFAAMRCGAVILPIHHQIKSSELADMIATTGLHAVIDDRGGVTPVEGASSDILIPGADPMRFAWTGAERSARFIEFVEDAAFVRFTSGTTGTSKGVVVSHKGILERTAAANAGLALSHEDTVICVLPMAFHFLVSIVLYLEVGSTVVITQDYLASKILELANRHSATFLYATPMHYRLLSTDSSGMGLKTLKRAVSTSSAMPAQLSQDFFKRYGVPVSQAYGIIEIGLPLVNLERPLERPESVGRALPGFDVAILGEDLRPLPDGEMGQLAIRGPGMFSAYLNPPRLAGEVLSNGWFLSGDLAVKDMNGYITVVGRIKSMINVAGNKVFPDEVEGVLNRHPWVEASSVSGRPHPLTGETVHADIVLKDPGQKINTEEVLKFCRMRLISYKAPQSITVVKEIDKTLSGKNYRRKD